MFRKETDPIEILVKNQPKIKLCHINEIVRIATLKDFHGGCKKIKQILESHADPNLKIEFEKSIHSSNVILNFKCFYEDRY